MKHEKSVLFRERRAQQPTTAEVRFLRLREVMAISGKSRSSLYEAIKEGSFPPPIKLNGRSSAWVNSEVMQWAQSCIDASRAKSR